MSFYQWNKGEVISRTNSSLDGLSNTDRSHRLEKEGYNELTVKKQRSEIVKFLSYFNDLIMYVLIFAGILKAVTGSYVEMVIIYLVVIMNAVIGYSQEKRAQESLDGISKLLSLDAVIKEEGKRKKVETRTLVVGDYIYLKAGDVLPADVRLLEIHDLIIEESILTGESLPVEKHDLEDSEERLIGDQRNMAFSGTLVQSGSAEGIVVATGKNTEIGKINEELQTMSKQETPLIRKMNHLNKQIVRVIIASVIFLTFFSTFYYKMSYSAVISAIIALIISTVPEGLPAILSIILSLGVNRMADQNAVIKQLSAVETLGSMTVICSDKTGTLTKNEMKVVFVLTKSGTLDCRSELPQSLNLEEKELVKIIQNCEETVLEKNQDISKAIGNPTEAALIQFGHNFPSADGTIIDKMPFDSKNKYMASLHDFHGELELFVKGAPDILINYARYEFADGAARPIQKDWWMDQASKLAGNGQRVLAVGYKNRNQINRENPFDNITEDLIIVGLVGIIDPPKEEAIAAVTECRTAGIAVKMITGDHKDTARAIAEQIGLSHTSNALEGKDIDAMTDEELQNIVMETDIFARTTPTHKLRIVKALQKNDQIVGMTGDGVNDAPALKRADIGVSMGIKGSQVSQEASDMVLTDDNFATISKAVKEGRRVYDNLKKTIYFFLPTALAQGWLVIYSLLTNKPLPLTAIQILWLNMVSTITLSYALGFERAEEDIMKRPPRNVKENILNPYAIFRIIYVSILIMAASYLARDVAALMGAGEAIQQTVLIQTIVVGQGVYMVNCREFYKFPINRWLFKNKALWISLGAMGLLQAILIYVPPVSCVIETAPLNPLYLGITMAFAILIFVVVECEKLVSNALLNYSSN